MNEWDEEDWKRFEEALRDSDPWDLASELELPPPDISALRNLAARLDAERTRAVKLLEPLLKSLEKFQEADVVNLPAFRTPTAVAVLTSAAVDLYERQPTFALAVATAAVNLGEALYAVDHLPSTSVLGMARVERGKVLFLIGRYRDAEEELRLADRAFDLDPLATEWEYARASLVRANVYAEEHRFEEAIEEAEKAARAFRTFGDPMRYLAARLVVGGILFMRGQFRAAASSLDMLITEARTAGDRLHLARALQTAGNCYIELGDHERARAYFFEALGLWRDLGLDVERVRTHWSIGVLHKSLGDLEGAIIRIDEARRSFEELGIVNDAAIARLELAETLLLAERPEEVPDLLRNVVVSFTNEGIMHRARIALAYLREAVDAGAVEARLVRHVRHYLEELPSNPAIAFIPLQ